MKTVVPQRPTHPGPVATSRGRHDVVNTLADICAPHSSHEHAREERELVAMLSVYRTAGGVVSGAALAAILRHHCSQPVSVVARWLVQRAVLSFQWLGQALIPLFQFDPISMCPRLDTLAVVRELTDAFADWELALWFASPNTWLDDVCPVARLHSDPESVLRAAQADRFIALG